jgi:hypothetical protein
MGVRRASSVLVLGGCRVGVLGGWFSVGECWVGVLDEWVSDGWAFLVHGLQGCLLCRDGG